MASAVPLTASRRALEVLNNSAMVRRSVGEAVATARDGSRTAGQFPGQSEVTSNLFERVVRHSAKLGADVDDVLVRGAGGQAEIQALHDVASATAGLRSNLEAANALQAAGGNMFARDVSWRGVDALRAVRQLGHAESRLSGLRLSASAEEVSTAAQAARGPLRLAGDVAETARSTHDSVRRPDLWQPQVRDALANPNTVGKVDIPDYLVVNSTS